MESKLSPTPQKSVVLPKKKEVTPIVKKEGGKLNNIRSTEWSNDFVSYFQKDLWDNITKEWLLKFGFTEKQILDNTFDFLKSKDNKLWDKEVNKKNLLKIWISSEQIERNTFSNWISLEDIFYELKSWKLSSYPIK